jgi:hypothetical protein
MLLLAAFSRIATPAEAPANDLVARSQSALGHFSLTIIALVYVLTTFWKG